MTDRQCPSCGGFCKKECERADVKQSEQEPVAWMYVNTDGECEQIEYGEPLDDPSVTPLYTAPPSIEAAVLAEREACARVCEEGMQNETDWDTSHWNQACENRAAAIRARSEK